MIVVTGASGNAGSRVVRALGTRGERVRAFVRDPGRARDVLGGDVELAVGDFADPASVRAALEGADVLLLSCARLRQGAAAQVSPDVETLTGSAPRDFACFAPDHARLFAPAAAAARR